MKVNSVVAEYLKLNPRTNYHPVPETGKGKENGTEINLNGNKDVAHSKESKESYQVSNPMLREILTKEEKKTLKDLFGTESMAQINKILDSNGSKIGELPRGILVNVKV